MYRVHTNWSARAACSSNEMSSQNGTVHDDPCSLGGCSDSTLLLNVTQQADKQLD
jgi:hypothetical protein